MFCPAQDVRTSIPGSRGYVKSLQACLQVGLPSYAEMTEAVLDYKLRAAGYNVRSFVTSALENRDDGTEQAAGDQTSRSDLQFPCIFRIADSISEGAMYSYLSRHAAHRSICLYTLHGVFGCSALSFVLVQHIWTSVMTS